YTFTTQYDGSITFHGIPTSTLGLGFTLYNAQGTTSFASQYGAKGEEVQLTYNNLLAGTYNIQVRREYIDGAYTFGAYSLQNTFTPTLYFDGNDSEPNNIVSETQTITINSSTTAHIGYSHSLPAAVSVWYTITTPHDGSITFHGIPTSTLG